MRTLRRAFGSAVGSVSGSGTFAFNPVGALGAVVSTSTVTLPVPTPAPGTLSVVATSVCVPSGTVAALNWALPPASVMAPPKVVPAVLSLKVTVLPTTGVVPPLVVTWTARLPCQPGVPVSLSSMQLGSVAVDGQSTAPAVGVVKVTTGAAPIVTVQVASTVALLPSLVEQFAGLPAFSGCSRRSRAGREQRVSGLAGSADAVLVAALAAQAPNRMLTVIADQLPEAERWLADLQSMRRRIRRAVSAA